MKKFRVVETVACLLLAGALFALTFLRAIPGLKSGAGEEGRIRVVRLWNIDTFEGGRGSRTAFLSRIAAAYEKGNPGALVMVSSYTA